jgi:hypothetical protein
VASLAKKLDSRVTKPFWPSREDGGKESAGKISESITYSDPAPGSGRPILEGVAPMLAEKFILLIETLRSRAHPDGSPRVVSTSPHIPVKLPDGNAK